MSKPKGFKKIINLKKPVTGNLRRDELYDDVARGEPYLPKGVMLEDMDREFLNFAEQELSITLDGEKIPVILLTIQKWSEFTKTWQNSDSFGNIEIPFITIVRNPDVQAGENQGGYFNIPGRQNQTYIKVPTHKNGRNGMDIYEVPQPTPVDITYEVRFFGNRMRDLNKIHNKILHLFNSRQHYIRPNEHFMPLHLEGVSDESETSDLNARRYYVQLFEIKLLGYILDPSTFEVTEALNRAIVVSEVSENKCKPNVKVKVGDGQSINFSIISRPNAATEVSFNSDYDVKYQEIVEIINVSNIEISVDGTLVTLPFIVKQGQKINIDFDKNQYLKGQFILKGIIL